MKKSHNLWPDDSQRSTPLDEAALRRRAEAIAQEQAADIGSYAAEDLRRLVHELQVHQIELKLQNEALLTLYLDRDAAQKNYADLYDTAPVGYVTLDEEGVILTANQTAASLLAGGREELIGDRLSRFVAPEEQDVYHFYCRRLFKTTAVQRDEIRFVREDGTAFDARLEGQAVRPESAGQAAGRYRLTLSDVTERRRAEALLRRALTDLAQANQRLQQEIMQRKYIETVLQEREAHYRTIVEDQTDLICRFWPDGRLTFVNEAYCRYYGRTREELIGDYFWPFIYESDRKSLEKHLAALTAETPVSAVDHRVETPAGETRWQRRTDRAIFDAQGRVVEFQTVSQDITARKQVEAALEESRSRLQALFNYALDAILLADDEARYVDVNPAACALLGYSRPELLQMQVFDLTPEVNRETSLRLWHAFIEAGEQSGEFPMHHKDKRLVEVEYHAVANIVPGLHLSIVRDITTRKQAEEAIRKSEQRLRLMVEKLPAGAVYRAGDNIFINEAVERITGYSRIELATIEAWFELLYGPDSRRIRQLYQETKRQGFSSPAVGSIIRKDGRPRLIEFVGYRCDRGEVWLLNDITERQQAEEEKARLFARVSRQREQLRALAGRLAEVQEIERKKLAQALHDHIGRNLTAVDLNLNIIRSQIVDTTPAANPVWDRLEGTLELVAQTARYIRNMMAELRPPVLDDYGLAAALRWYQEQLAVWTNVDVTVQGQPLQPRLPAPVELALFRIAQEALANVIEHAQAHRATVTLAEENDVVRLTVRDDGIGFDPAEQVDRVNGQHWGLISMVERAEAAGGQCRIESSAGRGTAVTVVVNRSPGGEP